MLKGKQHKEVEKLGARSRPHIMRLSQICAGQLTGEEDVINDRNYTVTVTCCSSQGVAYCIDADEFFLKFEKDEKTWGLLR